MPIANEYNYYTPGGSTDTAGSFAYWTDPIVDYSSATGAPAGDSTHTMIAADGKNTPAPWVPYTRAGCDFGSVAAANTELENLTPDVPLVFGANSPEAKEGQLQQLGAERDAVAAQMQAALLGAEFGGQPLSAGTAHALIGAGNYLLSLANTLAG